MAIFQFLAQPWIKAIGVSTVYKEFPKVGVFVCTRVHNTKQTHSEGYNTTLILKIETVSFTYRISLDWSDSAGLFSNIQLPFQAAGSRPYESHWTISPGRLARIWTEMIALGEALPYLVFMGAAG